MKNESRSFEATTLNHKQANVAPELHRNDENNLNPQFADRKLTSVQTIFEPLLTSSEAAELLRMHEKTVQKFARDGKLPGCKIGKAWMFRASLLDDWVRSALQSQVTVTA